ncbi:hypothetical protein HBH56_077660 [Parastagonospora nodorum]|uniref:Apple domain-containing protein n=1 Tax=Phaeosphaeria nodorum (strain SN15 / ATCC MYA-4574 / FGSC 10173) TaxID=321614 RepID=A0A7U2IBU8_PHANO|nr:hypothetical protein HBH56_077660 [Parastagonospora nodorum]QRD06964.1 hypothetical protein JI435_126300 [Parastagonospora nodorum SN15]KAH3923427.1 hypothetical protein HBH54_210300 [Parastagonospora nodorum]KAH3981848.1 hypothetical protein HBH51_044570 [Parastagonospora nodorum]KAH4045738.1 hypothetical protein HBH49_194740 [Parastagonospora nodorum]
MSMPQVTSILLFFLFALRTCLADQNPFAPGNGDFNPFEGLPDANNFRPMGAAQARQLGSGNAPDSDGYGQGTPAVQAGNYNNAGTGTVALPTDITRALPTEGLIRRGPASVTTIPGATATGNFAREDTIYSDAPLGEIEVGTAAAGFGASPTGYARDTEYICPADNGVTYSTGGKCFELHCNSATTLNVGVAEEFPSASLKKCAEACGRNNQCVACDVHGQGARNPGKCLLFRGTPPSGKLTYHRDIHYWVMLNANQCSDNRDQSPNDRDRYPDDRDSRNSYGIDPQVASRAADACDRQYNGARPTPLFNERGRPVCCGPIKNYDRYGQVTESCPPSRSDRNDERNDDRRDDSQLASPAQDDDSGGGDFPEDDDSGGSPRRN